MNARLSIGTIGIVVLTIAVGSLWYYERNSREVSIDPIPKEEGYIPQIINAKHQLKNGIHTIAGEIDLPTPCYLLETSSFVEVREPEEDLATVLFTTVNESDVCAQVITSARFKVVFGAGENAEIFATWNGKPVLFNLIKVSPEEDLDLFELFIKG